MQAPLQASHRIKASQAGLLNDIWETPKVLRAMLEKHLKVQEGAGSPYPSKPTSKATSVDIPNLLKPLPQSHGFAGQSPLEVMSGSKGTASFSNKFVIIGCGTSFHAALVAEYLLEHIARIPVEVQYASEFRYKPPLARPGDVLVVVSSSGETYDAVESLRLVKGSQHGSKVVTVAVVNKAESTIGRESDVVIDAMAGDEVGVTSTKSFSATVAAFVLLAITLGEARGTLPETERRALLEQLEALPDRVQEVLDRESKPLRPQEHEKSLEIGECVLWDISCQNVLSNNFIFLGRGFNFPIALEGAMKCKELAYIHAEGYPAAEMKHGPIALVDQFMPVVCIAPRADPSYEKIKANIEEVKARNGSIIAITEYQNQELEEICEYVIGVPQTHEYLMPLLSVIPLQLLAFMMGALRGNEVNNPRGLQRCVSTAPEGGSLQLGEV